MTLSALAIVTKVLPERHGVLVRFPSGISSYDTGEDDGPFVRVLARRAHAAGGSEIELPQVGELGVVMELDDQHQVWMGSIHWQDRNQIDPTLDLSMRRHTSGVTHQVRANGDTQLNHPSGLRITIAEARGAIPELQRNGDAAQPPVGPVDVEVAHPSGWNMHLDNDGALTLGFPSGALISVDKDGKMAVKDFSEVAFQGANARFCMEALFDWAKVHTHTSAAPGSPTSAAITMPPDTSLSPNAFKGPHA